jgi:hypothetical protein
VVQVVVTACSTFIALPPEPQLRSILMQVYTGGQPSFAVAFLLSCHILRLLHSGPIPALALEMLNLLAAPPSFPQAAAVAASVAVLGIVVRRRFFSPISDVPGPFWGSFSLLWQLHKIFTKHTERATIDAHKKWGAP